MVSKDREWAVVNGDVSGEWIQLVGNMPKYNLQKGNPLCKAWGYTHNFSMFLSLPGNLYIDPLKKPLKMV